MRKVLSIIMILAGIVLISFSISITVNRLQDNPNGSSNVSRTVMIYMSPSNLESDGVIGTSDIASINYKDLNYDDLKIVMMLGGTEKWYTEGVSTSETSIFEINNNGLSKVKEQDVKNMGDAENLTSFLNYAYDNYKTDEYILLLYGHGAAIQGAVFDELQNQDYLKVKEIQDGIGNSKFKNNKLELVIFRTCLNGTLEVANALKDYSKFAIASEETTIGTPMYPVLDFINDIKREDSTIDVGKKWIESYAEDMNKLNSQCSLNSNTCGGISNFNVTYSMINLSKIDKVNESLDSFSKVLLENVEKKYNEFLGIREKMDQYAYTEESSYDMVDAYDFANKYSKYDEEGSANLKTSIAEAVVYNSANNDYSHGLSIYFPFYSKHFLGSVYDRVSVSDNYKDFITKLIDRKSDYLSYINTSRGENNYLFETNVDKANNYYLMLLENDSYIVVYQSNNVTTSDNKTRAYYIGKEILINEKPVYAIEYKIDKTKSYFKVPAVLSKGEKTEDVYILIVYDNERYYSYIGGVSKRSEEEINEPNMKVYNFDDYEKIELIGYNYINGKFEETRTNVDFSNYSIDVSDIDLEKNYYGLFETEKNSFTEPIKVE